jgi:hypothetical protein
MLHFFWRFAEQRIKLTFNFELSFVCHIIFNLNAFDIVCKYLNEFLGRKNMQVELLFESRSH